MEIDIFKLKGFISDIYYDAELNHINIIIDLGTAKLPERITLSVGQKVKKKKKKPG